MTQVIKSYAQSQTTMGKARFSFTEIESPTLPIWNDMIRGLCQSGSPIDALELFDEMRVSGWRGNNLTFIYACKACARVPSVLYGKRVHGHVLKLGFGSYLFVCNALIHMYGFCGELDFARRVFDEMGEKDMVSWNSLICAYSQSAEYREVLGVFQAMTLEGVKADAVIMVKVMLACNNLGEWELFDSLVPYVEDNSVDIDVFLGNTLIDVYGRRGLTELAWGVFDRMNEKNVVSWNMMISVAAKSGDLVKAKKLFVEMPKRDAISWSTMITVYAQANQHDDAIRIFQEMLVAEIKPDDFIVSRVLSACAHSGRFDVGEAVHDYISTSGSIKSDLFVTNALIDMYCKCGSVEKALDIFQKMKEKDSVSWTSVIYGVAVNGDSGRALELFSQMLIEGTTPIHGSFVGILVACAHAGLVDKGLEFFRSMQEDYGLVPEMRHYGCVVDLLCRASDLPRAYEFIKNMPIVPDIAVWNILLSACKLHGNLVLAKIASDRLLELDPTNGGNFVLLSNSYASAERWDDAIKIREMMDKDDVLKPLGWSSIETNHETS